MEDLVSRAPGQEVIEKIKQISLHRVKKVKKKLYIAANDNSIVRKSEGGCKAAGSGEDADVKHLIGC